MVIFLIVGIIGLLILTVSLVLGEIIDGLLGALDFGIPTPVIGAFLAAFGFGGALILAGTSASVSIAALGGLGSGVGVGGLAFLVTKSLMNMPTDEPVRSGDLVGSTASVITKIPADGLGEITLSFRGQIQKLGARSSTGNEIPAGSQVTITAVTSSSSVVVEPVA